MRVISGKLYVEFGEMVECGVSEKYLWKAKSTGVGCWEFVNDPADKRRVLIGWDALKQTYRQMVEVRYGNPWEHVAREPILRSVVSDWKAEEYYRSYTYQVDGAKPGEVLIKHLPGEAVVKYTRGAAWLAFVNSILSNKERAKKEFGMNVLELMEHVTKLVALEKERGKAEDSVDMDVLPADFPSSYQRLITKAQRYAALGYDVMISPLYGNKCAAKIGKVAAAAEPAAVVYAGGNVPAVSENEGGNVPVLVPKNGNKQGVFAPEAYQRQMAVIRAVCEKHQNLDAAQVKDLVNSLFAANGWKTLSVATIRRIIRENEHLLTAGRAGRRAHKSTIARQVKRVVTELPLAYWTMDGWTAELMYQERGAKGMEYRRLVIVVVLDAWTKYPIGYAIGDRENVDLIKAALKNALLHVRELFGEVYRPVQLQSDNYQIKNLTPFYTAVAHMHTPAEVGNAKAKVVEPYFKHLNKTYCQKQMNWTGFNVTARKENQVNAEYLNKVKGTFPDRNGVVKQLTYMMERERQLKREGYVAKWPEMPEDRKYRMSEMEWLSVFAKPIGKTNRITGEGLVKTIDGEKYVYDSFDPEFRALRHLNWQLYAEPGNMERVLVRDEDGKHAFVLEKTRVIPMDAWSATEDDHAYRAQITGYNKERETEVTELYAHDATVAREVVENTPLAMSSEDELALKLLLVHNGQQKEALQDAKGLPQAKKRLETMTDDAYQAEWQRRQEERMRGISDFDKY